MVNNRAEVLKKEWDNELRWVGVERPYEAEDVIRLRGSLDMQYTLADRGAKKLWELINNEPYINALGADGESSSSASKSRIKGNLSEWLASSSGCKYGWPNVPGPKLVSCK